MNVNVMNTGRRRFRRPEIHFDRSRTCTGMNIERSTLTDGSPIGSLVPGSARVGNRVPTCEKSDVSSRVSPVSLNAPLCNRERVHASASVEALSQGVIDAYQSATRLRRGFFRWGGYADPYEASGRGPSQRADGGVRSSRHLRRAAVSRVGNLLFFLVHAARCNWLTKHLVHQTLRFPTASFRHRSSPAPRSAGS